MLRHISIVSLLVLLTACGTSPKTNFYVLDSGRESTSTGVDKSNGPVIAIWPVKLPDFLDRSEIVTRNSQFQVELADFSWWAGGLGQDMTRLLARELSEQLESDKIVSASWSSRYEKDFQIITHVERFDGELGGEVVLEGLWILLDGEGKNELSRKDFNFKTTAAGKTYEAMVAALSQLTVKLSQQMAGSITAYKAKSK